MTSSPTVAEIAACIEAFANPGLQEKWDNTGWQLRPASVSTPCSGVLLCLDVTPEVVAEASAEGCNMIVSHHPLLFNGLKQIGPDEPGQRAVIDAIKAGIFVYSSHTALDSAKQGVSHRLGAMLGLSDVRVLVPRAADPSTGLGIVGEYAEPMDVATFIDKVKAVYGMPLVRVSDPADHFLAVRHVALCSGSGGEFLADALAAGADAYISSDIRYHDFVDFGSRILIVDTGHFESEICTKSIFSDVISEKFPTFAVRQSSAGRNPVRYL